ncbi:MAG: alpha/beta fold hydrolase [Bacteriovoracaceae bacterium]
MNNPLKFSIVSIFILYSFLAQAVRQEDLSIAWGLQIFPFFQQGQEITFLNKNNLKIQAKYFKRDGAKGSIVILPGRTVSALQYSETIYDFYERGYSVLIMDHQGQGDSDRYYNDTRGHVIQFMDYVEDLETLIESHLPEDLQKPLFLVGHSMGGAVAAIYHSKHPRVFNKVALVAPMIRVRYTGVTFVDQGLIPAVINSMNRTSMRNNPIRFYIETKPVFSKSNIKTNSPERYSQLMVKIPSLFPHIIVKAPTWHWLKEASSVVRILKDYPQTLPTRSFLLVQAGNDKVVSNKAQKVFCHSDKVNCEIENLQNTKHELFFEKDEHRERLFDLIENYFKLD